MYGYSFKVRKSDAPRLHATEWNTFCVFPVLSAQLPCTIASMVGLDLYCPRSVKRRVPYNTLLIRDGLEGQPVSLLLLYMNYSPISSIYHNVTSSPRTIQSSSLEIGD